MTDKLSSAPPFSLGNVTFRLWITENGQQYEWRSNRGELSVGRNVGSSTCWAKAGPRVVGRNFRNLKEAMVEAVRSAMGRSLAA